MFLFVLFFFFFFKQKTAYEMRISDWSSDVCSSDLEEASRALGIPLVGFDFLVPDPAADDYVVIEANERPGLANHEPQPTAERFVDMLFPQTVDRSARTAVPRNEEVADAASG